MYSDDDDDDDDDDDGDDDDDDDNDDNDDNDNNYKYNNNINDDDDDDDNFLIYVPEYKTLLCCMLGGDLRFRTNLRFRTLTRVGSTSFTSFLYSKNKSPIWGVQAMSPVRGDIWRHLFTR